MSRSDAREHYVDERLSLRDQLCTVRYVGEVANKPGTWLGVEWDDPTRGKHNGTHEDHVYFHCRSKSPKCASFLRPSQAWDLPRTFLQALRQKYMPDAVSTNPEAVYFSGKQAEEIGFEKFHQRQAKLQGIHVLVLDHMRIQHRQPTKDDEAAIPRICSDITELDVGANLFETCEEVCALCQQLPQLRVLTLDGNRFCTDERPPEYRFEGVKTLSLARTLIHEVLFNGLLGSVFPSVTTLSLTGNEDRIGPYFDLPWSVRTLDLSDNDFTHLGTLGFLSKSNLQTLIVKRNRISAISKSRGDTTSLMVKELDLSYNSISTFDFFNSITIETFPNLRHLRVTGNPLYTSLVSAEGKPLTPEDGYMLTIARMPQLEYLNYSKIAEKERLNAETYYLSQIAIELGSASKEQEAHIISKHLRFRELCDEYGEPNVQRKTQKGSVDPNTLAARLVSVTFALAEGFRADVKQRTWTEDVPKSFSIYAVLGLVGKRLKQKPLELRLVLETNYRDPVGSRNQYAGPEWWDSSDDEAASDGVGAWVKREVDMVPGTRALATYVERHTASVRVEMRDKNG